MINKLTLFLIIILSVIAAVIFTFYTNYPISQKPVLTPTSSVSPAKSDLIKVENPLPNQLVKSPMTFSGEARGYWFFEASFPIRVYDANGKELGVAVAQVQGDPVKSPVGDNGAGWMTEDFVSFSTTLELPLPETSAGVVVFEKDNPSGLPEHADEVRIPVRFDLAGWGETPILSGECKITGCSGQICTEEEVITTCEFLSEYACYKTAKCERQEDGKCGWTPTEELVACLGAAFQAEN